jgi:hypothetical protein
VVCGMPERLTAENPLRRLRTAGHTGNR